jgi:signal peptide peptidase SppA
MNAHPEMIYAINPAYYDYVASRTDRIQSLKPEAVRLAFDAANARNPELLVESGTAIIRLKGIMEKVAFFADEVSTIRVRRELALATESKKVSSIMLAVDSPGGIVSGIPELGAAIRAARSSKPVVAQVEGQASSAGYWAASQASRIGMHSTDTVGSIGVRMVLYDKSKMAENEGVEPVVIDTGDYKSLGVAGTPITDDHKKYLQGLADQYFKFFKQDIMKGRRGSGLSSADLDKIADGRSFIGQDAVDKKLADEVVTSERTLAELGRMKSRERQRAEDYRKRVELAMKT